MSRFGTERRAEFGNHYRNHVPGAGLYNLPTLFQFNQIYNNQKALYFGCKTDYQIVDGKLFNSKTQNYYPSPNQYDIKCNYVSKGITKTRQSNESSDDILNENCLIVQQANKKEVIEDVFDQDKEVFL